MKQLKMSKKRGLSLDEKRTKMLEIFYEKKDFFLLKELEKIAPKEKGIISMSVKDVLQSLVDDNLIDTEKIGTSVYFWAFPSKATANRKRKLSDQQEMISEISKKQKEVVSNINLASVGREDTEGRIICLKKLNTLKETKNGLESSLQRYRDCDPEVLVEMQKEIELSKNATNRWTDNIYALHSWIGKKFPAISINDLNKQFGIPEDLDYVE